LAVSLRPSNVIRVDVSPTENDCETAVPGVPPPSVSCRLMLRVVVEGLLVELLNTTF